MNKQNFIIACHRAGISATLEGGRIVLVYNVSKAATVNRLIASFFAEESN